jgi:PepSY-associated TM helix.
MMMTATTATAKANAATTTKVIRLLHRYLGLFFAPAIVFFAVTGALQTFGWHETSKGGSYVPSEWLVRLAQLHKKQTLLIPAAKTKPPKIATADSQAPAVKKSSESLDARFALKCFVFVMSLALMLTTILGVVMALRFGGKPRTVWMVVAAGTLFPIAVVLVTRP